MEPAVLVDCIVGLAGQRLVEQQPVGRQPVERRLAERLAVERRLVELAGLRRLSAGLRSHHVELGRLMLLHVVVEWQSRLPFVSSG